MLNRIFIALFILAGIIACNQAGNEAESADSATDQQTSEQASQTPTPAQANKEQGELYVSDDGSFRLRVMSDHDNNPETIRLRDEGSGNDYVLEHVAAASGVKYLNGSGYFFWVKGEEFTWGLDNETLQTGHLRK